VDPLGDRKLQENEHPIFVIHADLAVPTEVGRVVELALARYNRIDAIVNAAACWVMGPLIDSDAASDSAEKQFLLNVIVPLRLSVEAARSFWRDREEENRTFNRCVVNVSSSSGVHIYRGLGQAIYSASKAALNYLTCHMSDEFQRIGVRVNGLAPSSFPETIATADVAACLVRLIESQANGQIVVLDADREYLTP
jgi:NAD(P)-dependent dehydrogenase (short-subunit alcohol dehydrogenase family)